jgi:hypothetical protein
LHAPPISNPEFKINRFELPVVDSVRGRIHRGVVHDRQPKSAKFTPARREMMPRRAVQRVRPLGVQPRPMSRRRLISPAASPQHSAPEKGTVDHEQACRRGRFLAPIANGRRPISSTRNAFGSSASTSMEKSSWQHQGRCGHAAPECGIGKSPTRRTRADRD